MTIIARLRVDAIAQLLVKLNYYLVGLVWHHQWKQSVLLITKEQLSTIQQKLPLSFD